MPSKSITIACIVSNAASGIETFYRRLETLSRELPVQVNILLVDDGSTDGTYERLQAVIAGNAAAQILRLSRHFGEGGAVTAALNHAVGDAVLLVVGIDQPLDLVADMVAQWRAGSDIVWTAPPDDAAKAASALVRVTDRLSQRTGLPKDHVFALTLLSAPVVRIWRSLPHRDDHLPLTLASYGFRQTTIQSDKISVRAVAAPVGVISSFVNRLIDNSILPVRLTSTVGVIIAMAALAYIVIVAIRAFIFDLGEPGWSSLVVTILFVASAQIISIGILAEYLWRVFEQTRSTPRYIIQDCFGTPSRSLDPAWSLDPLDLDTSKSRRETAEQTKE